MPLVNKLNTACDWDELEDQVHNKVNEIAQDEEHKSHGGVADE
jgi:hypothetical protein